MESKDIKSINLKYEEGQKLEQAIAEYILEPKTLGAFVLEANKKQVSHQLEYEYAREVIGKGIEEIKKGDLSKLEEMFYSQAVALNMMFTSMSKIALHQSGLPQFESHMRFALKAQNQSRATLQALMQLKQPSNTQFIKQANIANGHQQINNGVSPEKLSKETNELLEVQDGKRLDGGTQAETKAINSELEAMDTVHRGKNSRRKSKVK